MRVLILSASYGSGHAEAARSLAAAFAARGAEPVVVDHFRDLVHPAISRLAQLIDSAESDAVKLAAVRDVLDRAGYKAPEKLQAEHDITIEIVRKSSASAFALKPPNGHTNGRAD